MTLSDPAPPDGLTVAMTTVNAGVGTVSNGVNIAGMDNTDRVRHFAQQSVDELFSLMKPPSAD